MSADTRKEVSPAETVRRLTLLLEAINRIPEEDPNDTVRTVIEQLAPHILRSPHTVGILVTPSLLGITVEESGLYLAHLASSHRTGLLYSLRSLRALYQERESGPSK